MRNKIAILVYSAPGTERNALTEEKYHDLSIAFSSAGFDVRSVSYNDSSAAQLTSELLHYHAILVWVNPIEQGHDRKRLDAMLLDLAGKGCYVSTHPDVILKLGTKDILYKTRDMSCGSDVKLYDSFEDFVNRFPDSLKTWNVRVLKQYRGNGGNGVFKIMYDQDNDLFSIQHAQDGSITRILSQHDFFAEFKTYFGNEGLLIDQEWNPNMANGMVRCYSTGTKVAGFGYQEINALYEDPVSKMYMPPGKRYYFTENCGLFSDLKMKMEEEWIPQLMDRLNIIEDMMPVIWDADFFINDANERSKYTLCEINVSCVSPFPPSAVRYIVEKVKKHIMHPESPAQQA